jgi:hypothetical protein
VTPANPTASEQVAALRGEVAELKLALGQLAVITFPHIYVPSRRDFPELAAIATEYRDKVNAAEAEKERRLAELDAQRQQIENEVKV